MSAYAPDPRPRALVRANVGKGAGVTAGALAAMVVFTAAREGEVRHSYRDPVGVLSYCYGETHGAVEGKTYTHAECVAALTVSARKHAEDAQRCLPAGLPDRSAAMFYDAAYNAGGGRFCRSSIPVLAARGDLRGACVALKTFAITAKGKDCRVRANRCYGVVQRRIDASAECLRGLQ